MKFNNYHMIIESKSKEDGFKIAVDPLLDYTTTKNIDVDSLESTSVEELASFVPDESSMTNTPYSGERYWNGEN